MVQGGQTWDAGRGLAGGDARCGGEGHGHMMEPDKVTGGPGDAHSSATVS